MFTRQHRLALGFTAAAALVAFAGAANAAAVRPGLFGANSLAANDDGSTGAVALGFTANFFGVSNTQAFVNNNGNITFNGPLSTFTPFDLNTTNTPIIAPFFADVDTRGAASDIVHYGNGVVNGRNAFGVNWVNVGYFPGMDRHLNSFQLVMIDRSDINAGDFDFEFNYDAITWEAGTASGSNSDGLGGSSARAGFANGTTTPGTFFELNGSAVNGAFLDTGPAATSLIHNSLNSNVLGRYVFTVRNGQVVIPGVPLPTAGLMGLAGLGGVVGLRRRR